MIALSLIKISISIHALRVEGDACTLHMCLFLSSISIHALRVEGDIGRCSHELGTHISIHALRVEGDKNL